MSTFIFVFICGIVVGICIFVSITANQIRRTDGNLLVDTTDPNKDIYRLEITDEFENLAKKKAITLKIVHKPIPHK